MNRVVEGNYSPVGEEGTEKRPERFSSFPMGGQEPLIHRKRFPVPSMGRQRQMAANRHTQLLKTDTIL